MRAALVLAIASLLVATAAFGQTASLSRGDTVRIWASAHGLVAAQLVAQGVHPDSLDLVASGGATPVTRVPWTDISRLEVRRGEHSRWRGALLWGGAIGLGGALAAGSLTRNPGDREATVPLAFWGGFGIGAVLGSLRDPTRWVRVPLPRP